MRLPRDFRYVFGLRAPSTTDAGILAATERLCGSCRYFRNDPAYLEAAIPGLSSLSSGAASARAEDGLCLLRDRYLSARASCARFAAPLGASPPAASL
jgi:hypothetical protein